MNQRNDLLHGNAVIDKLKFSDVYFQGNMPVFKEYRSMWARSLGVEMNAVGLLEVEKEVNVVDNLASYLLSCLRPEIRDQVKNLVECYELGYNASSGRLGILFPDWLVDFRAGPPEGRTKTKRKKRKRNARANVK